MRLHTLDDIRRTVSAAAFEKATLYQRRRRAFVSDMADDGTRIEGRVQGTQRRPYTVIITLEISSDGKLRIDGSCSCPVAFNCKHVAALLIESMTTPEGRQLASSAARPVLPPQAESWLADLDRAMALSDDEYPPSIRQRLIYVLSIDHGVLGSPQPVLELKSVRLLKDDILSSTVSNYDPQSAFSSTPAKFLRGHDLPVLRRLLDLRGLYGHGGGRGHPLSGETGAEVLELVLATGRCRWQSPDGPVMRAGEPRRGGLSWTMMDSGAQKPVVSVEGGGSAVCVVPPWYVDAAAAVCGPLQIGVPPRVAAVLMQAPAIEPQQVVPLRGKLAERLPDHEHLLPLEPSPPQIIGGPPTPILLLARRKVRPVYGSCSWAMPPAPQDIPVARLAFAYGPVILPANDQREKPLFAEHGRLFTVERDRTMENRQRKRLAAADARLAAIQAHPAYGLPPDARGELVLADDDPLAWPRFLVEVAPRLREEGWRIEIEPGFAPPLAEADGDVDAVLHEGSGIDWFEFDLGISVDGEVPVFLISLKAGGTGLNLTAADTVILYDPWWNPAVEAQAIDRSHRIGQDKPVFVHRLVMLNTIEEKMLELQRRKGALAEGLYDPEAGAPLDITADDIEMLLAGA
ncbi:MAG: SWIM zinc finger family protein [Rhodospirillales bacterium]|nr:SWIM zinc finger family protein [Rhodospirillales bacterium]